MFNRPSTTSLLSRTFHLFGAGFVPFVSLALLVQSPIPILTFLTADLEVNIGNPGDLERGLVFLGGVMVTLVLTMVATAALVYGVFQTLRGEQVSLGRCVHIAASRLPAVAGLSILSSLAMVVGFMLCIIPGIIVTCGFMAAVPALMVERGGVIESMERSWALTDGYKGQIFLVSLAIGVIQWVVNVAVGLLMFQAGTPFATAAGHLIGSGFGTALSAVAAAVVYHDLRGFREGLDEDELVAVFA